MKAYNTLRFIFDWLCFTFPVNCTLDSVFSFLGFNPASFSSTNHGGKGYKKMILCNYSNIRIYYDGNDDMGVNVQISGEAISYFLSCVRSSLNEGFLSNASDEDILRFILSLLLEIGCKFTRVDISLDDIGANYFMLDDIIAFRNNHQISSIAKCFQHVYSEDSKSYECTGNTIYFGKRSSGSFLRIYDKQLEQNAKLKDDNKISYPWVRWEIELKQEHADKVINKFISGISLNKLFLSVLSRLIRIHLNDDSNVSRCTTHPLWIEFLANAEKFSFDLVKPEPSIDRTERFLIHQSLPSLMKYISFYGYLPKVSKSQFNHIIDKWSNDAYWKCTLDDDVISFLSEEFIK